MGLPAARMLDSTIHGGLIVGGTPTTLIGNMPAARMLDTQACPMLTLLVPHVGGPILLGAFNVLVGNRPQARMTDTCVCAGPPSIIMRGHFQTLVGMAGLFGAGMSGALSIIVARRLPTPTYPRTVRRPDGTTDTEYSPQITIMGSPEYQATVIADLNHPELRELMAAVRHTRRRLVIRPRPRSMRQHDGSCMAMGSGAHARDLQGTTVTPGEGSDSTVFYNPSLSTSYRGEDHRVHSTPPHGVLGHEVRHHLNNARGENLTRWQDPEDPTGNMEESRVMGINRWRNERPTERTMGEPHRAARQKYRALVSSRYRDPDGQWYERSLDGRGNRVNRPIAPPDDRPNH